MITALAISQLTGYYTIDCITGPIYIDTIEGLGIPDPHVALYDLPYEHGSDFVSQYYKARKIAICGWVLGTVYAANRQTVANAFSFYVRQRDADI